MSNLTKSNNAWMPSLEARATHREWIVGRVLTLLNHYWRADDPVELSEALGRDWADVLEGLPQEYIQRAAIRFQQTSRSKPTPAAIYALARELMPPPTVVASAPPPQEPQRDRVSAARAEEIMNEIGFRPKRFN